MPFSYEDEYGRKYFRKLFFKKTLGEREDVILEEGDVALDEDGKIYFGDGTTTGGTELVTGSGGSSITLSSFSVTTAAAGTAALSYNNTSGVFTYTPPDLSSYQTSSGLNTAIDGHLNVSGASNNQVLSWNGSDYAWVNNSGGSGIALTDLSVGAEGSASGDGAIAYNNTSGVFTYTPPDLSSYLTSVPAQSFASLTGKPTTIAGYGITDAFDGDYDNLTNKPTIPAAYTNSDVDAHLNQSNPDSGYVLSWNGSDYAWVVNGTGTGLGDVVDDTTPQLGGTLDANGNDIDMGTNTITDTKVGQWDTAYGWGDHSTQGYLTSFTETNDLTAAVTWDNVPDTNITESSVTQHQAALSITESQISDLGTYLTAETSHADVVVDGDFASQGLMKRGATAGSYSIVTDNSANWNTAYGWGDHGTEGYLTSYSVTESDVTAHQAALSITESQISDLGTYLTSVAFDDLTSTPTTLSGYGITDGYANSDVDAHLNQSNPTDGYVLSWTSGDYAWVANGSGGGIALTDLSVTTASAGTAALSYNNSSGVFTYTPPDLSGYMQSGTALGTLTATSIEAEAETADSTDGNDFTMTGGDASGLNSTGGDANITGGSGALASGNVNIGATQTVTVSIGSSGTNVDFPSGTAVDFTGATVTGLSVSGLQSRTTKAGTTSSLADAAQADLDITGFKGYALLKVQTDRAARVRIYTDAASRTADASRAEGTDPAADDGVIAEVITTAAETVLISPGAFGYNNESTPTTTIPCRITNKSGSASTVTVTLHVLQLEA